MTYVKSFSAAALTMAAAIFAAVLYFLAFDITRLLVDKVIAGIIAAAPQVSLARWVYAHLEPSYLIALGLGLGFLPITARTFSRHVWPAILNRVIGKPGKPRS